MSKNTTKVTMSQKAPETLEQHLDKADAIIAEFAELQELPATEPKPETVIKVADEIKAMALANLKTPAKAPETPSVDITAILAAMPDTFTPALLDKAFNLNDGGKTVRRHLRKYFAADLGHDMKTKWTFTKADNSGILSYFAARYAFDAKAIG